MKEKKLNFLFCPIIYFLFPFLCIYLCIYGYFSSPKSIIFVVLYVHVPFNDFLGLSKVYKINSNIFTHSLLTFSFLFAGIFSGRKIDSRKTSCSQNPFGFGFGLRILLASIQRPLFDTRFELQGRRKWIQWWRERWRWWTVSQHCYVPYSVHSSPWPCELSCQPFTLLLAEQELS